MNRSTNEIKSSLRLWIDNTSIKDNRSLIWKKLSEDFGENSSDLRGYGLNNLISDRKIEIFRKFFKFSNIISVPSVLVTKAFRSIRMKYISFISYLILKDTSAHEKFGISSYKLNCYDVSLLEEYKDFFDQHRVCYSHNTLKAFFYFKKICKYLNISPPEKIQQLDVLEIGAGLFNFGYIITKSTKNFNYVIVDLPDMIISSVSEIMKHYEPDFEIYLPNEIDAFYKSESNRKVLFVTPDQIDKIQPSFDLFVNHESFSEMDISIVNDYLNRVSSLLRKGAYVFIVNRHSRVQAITGPELENISIDNITSFSDYDLDFSSPIVYEIDSFRQKLPGQNMNPNILYIGCIK